MALDEPKNDDKIVDLGACKVVLAPDVLEMVQKSGGVDIDFVMDDARRGYTIKLSNKDCGGGCDCGS
jgi:hypothetical protein